MRWTDRPDPFVTKGLSWWDEGGPFRILHQVTPLRMRWVLSKISGIFPISSPPNLTGLRVLDLGCGGGLMCEPLARLGANVTGIDTSAKAISCARDHALAQGLAISYLCGDASALSGNQQYDLILIFEVIEHVTHRIDFLRSCQRLLRRGGLLMGSTPNRTVSGFWLGIVWAQWIRNWVPEGGHRLTDFICPQELAAMMEVQGLTLTKGPGLSFDPLANRFVLSPNRDINYFFSATHHDRPCLFH